jgi:hypothetical protein
MVASRRKRFEYNYFRNGLVVQKRLKAKFLTESAPPQPRSLTDYVRISQQEVDQLPAYSICAKIESK